MIFALTFTSLTKIKRLAFASNKVPCISLKEYTRILPQEYTVLFKVPECE